MAEYRWTVLSNTTLATLRASLDSNIVLIALPTIATSLPGSTLSSLLWLLLGYPLATAVLRLNFGRLSDRFGRGRPYDLGFALFTLGSLLCGFAPSAWALVGFRMNPCDRRRLPLLRQRGDPDRRLPAEPAGLGAGSQPGGDRRRVGPGAGPRGRPHLGPGLTVDFLRQRADRPLRFPKPRVDHERLPPDSRGVAWGIRTTLVNDSTTFSLALAILVISSPMGLPQVEAVFLGTGVHGTYPPSLVASCVGSIHRVFFVSTGLLLLALLPSAHRDPIGGPARGASGQR